MEVCDIVQEAVIKTITKKKKCKKAKWLSERGLQTAKKRREAKGKGEKESRDFLAMQKIEENKRMGKKILKKIRDTKGAFHAKMGTIKDRNVMGLTEGEDIKKRWQEYTEELYKKFLMTQITTMMWSLT